MRPSRKEVRFLPVQTSEQQPSYEKPAVASYSEEELCASVEALGVPVGSPSLF
jgi:hypothetical protein